MLFVSLRLDTTLFNFKCMDKWEFGVRESDKGITIVLGDGDSGSQNHAILEIYPATKETFLVAKGDRRQVDSIADILRVSEEKRLTVMTGAVRAYVEGVMTGIAALSMAA